MFAEPDPSARRPGRAALSRLLSDHRGSGADTSVSIVFSDSVATFMVLVVGGCLVV